MTESTDKVAVGILTGLEPRQSGWFRFTVQEPGRQYPIRVDTKKPEIVEQCKALMGQSVKITYSERPSENINPNNGQPYTNRYLNEIAIAGTGDISDTPTTTTTQQQGTVVEQDGMKMRPDQAKELRIMREHAAGVAANMLEHLPAAQQNPKGIIEVAETFVAYYVYGPSRFGVQAFNDTVTQQGAEPEQQQAPEPEPQHAYTCEICGTHDENFHRPGCSNDIPF